MVFYLEQADQLQLRYSDMLEDAQYTLVDLNGSGVHYKKLLLYLILQEACTFFLFRMKRLPYRRSLVKNIWE